LSLLYNTEYSFSILLYISIFVFIAFFSYGVEHSKKSESKFIFKVLVFFVYLLPAILRYDIGADYSSYELAYNSNNNYFKEVGFSWLFETLKNHEKSSWYLFFWMSIITYFPLAFLVKDKYFFIQISYVLFMSYFKSYDQIRQACALVFLILSFQNVNNKKYIRCIIDIFIATSFHFSSLAILLVYLFSIFFRNQLIQKVFFLIFFVCVVTGLFKIILFQIIEIFIPTYVHYLDSMYGQKATVGSGIGIMLVLIFPFFYVILSNNVKNTCVLWASIFFIIFRLGTIQFSILGRVADIMWSGAIYSYTYINTYKTKYKKMAYS
jgi:hypothetical protein